MRILGRSLGQHQNAELYDGFSSIFRPIAKVPAMGRTNGMGSGLYGKLRDDRLSQGHIKVHFVSLLWLPVIPLSAYVVDGFYNEFRFYWKVSLCNLVKTYKWRVIPLYLSALVEGAGLAVLFIALLALVAGGVKLLMQTIKG